MLKLTLNTKGLIVVVAMIVVELLVGGNISFLVYKAETKLQEERHARDVIARLNTFSNTVQNATIGLLRELQVEDSPQSENFHRIYYDYLEAVPRELHQIKLQLKDNPRELQGIEDLETTCKQGVTTMERCRVAYQTHDPTELAYEMELHSISDNVTAKLKNLLESYQRMQQEGAREGGNSFEALAFWLFTGSALNVILITAMGLFLNYIKSRLHDLKVNSERLAAGQSLNPQRAGSGDEIAEVDVAFHRMADELAESARKERAIIENASDVICSIDVNERLTAVNPACKKVLLYTEEQLIGTRISEIVLSSEREHVHAALKEAIKNMQATTFESRLQKLNGEPIDVVWSVQWSAAERSLFCVLHDITERKQTEALLKASEARVRTVIENQPVGVVTVLADGAIETVNPSIEQLFGYATNELEGKNVSELFDNFQSSELAELSSKHAPGKTVELQGRKKGGDLFPVEVSSSKIQAFDGERILVNVQDVTERHEIERMKREFVAMISHDLRTPLASVRGTLTLLGEGVFDPKTEFGKERIDDAEHSVDRLINLVNDLLDLDKLEAGQLSLTLAPTKLSSLIELSVESVRVYAKQKEVALKVSTSDALLQVDADRMVQVMVNLLSNAIKFSDPGSAVEVLACQDGDFALLKVIDRGRGIPIEHQPSIFERFTQVETADGQRHKGSGLGLAIARAIVQSHQGEIGLESEGGQGQGSTFWIRLPLAPLTVKEKPELPLKQS